MLVVDGAALLDEPAELERRMQLESPWRMACRTHVRGSDGHIELWTPNWGGWPDVDEPGT